MQFGAQDRSLDTFDTSFHFAAKGVEINDWGRNSLLAHLEVTGLRHGLD